VRTFNIVGIDLKTRHRVSFTLIRHHKIAASLISIGAMCSLVDKDETRKDRSRFPKERIFKEKIRKGVTSSVMLEGPLIIFLAGIRQSD
jgi:hypothetical protein